MSEIDTYEAIIYGINHMLYLGLIYVIGFVIMGVGLIIIGDTTNNLLGLTIILGGAVLTLGGLHGAIYKMAGDATAKVIARSELQNYPTARKIPDDEANESDPGE